MRIEATTGLKKITSMKSRIKGVQGGQGAAKTFSFLLLLIDLCLAKPTEVIITSEELSKMRLTVIKDFKKILQSMELFFPDSWLGGVRYNFDNGSSIQFIGADKEDIGKGLRCDVVYFVEANKMNFEYYRQLSSRAKAVCLCFNPDSIFWYHSEVQTRKDCETLILTYQDNEALSQEEKNEILSYKTLGFKGSEVINDYWANKWRVYGLGLPGHLDGLIFDNWNLVREVPANAEKIAFGLDFGFSNDPSACIGVYKDGSNLYLDQILYKTNLTNPMIASAIRQEPTFNRTDEVIADSAEPKSIKELSGEGIRVYPSQKGRDSINNGIDILKRHTIHITERSKDLINEANSYTWIKDKKSGNHMNKPIDAFNHGWDAVRYVALVYLRKGRSLKVSVA